MKDYLWNVILSVVVSFIISVITFLIGNEAGAPSVASAMTSGAISGVVMGSSYVLGKMTAGEAWNRTMSLRYVLMLIFGVAAGLFGGWTMTL